MLCGVWPSEFGTEKQYFFNSYIVILHCAPKLGCCICEQSSPPEDGGRMLEGTRRNGSASLCRIRKTAELVNSLLLVAGLK
jgi:hypothetical protein